MVSGLAKKFQLKSEYSVLMLNSNPDVHPLFDGIRLQYHATENKGFDSVIMFARDEEEIGQFLPKADLNLKPKGLLWLTYPKKSGRIPTPLNRDITWNIVKGYGLEPVRLISLNDDWSSMRLVKQEERKKPSTFGQDPPGVDRTTKTVIPPEDLQLALNEHPNAAAFFEGLAFSHKREYVAWILNAKKQETRDQRVQKTIELLTAKKKYK
jgi:hypothetical protein